MSSVIRSTLRGEHWLSAAALALVFLIAAPALAKPGPDAEKPAAAKAASDEASDAKSKGSIIATANLLDIMRQGGALMWPLAFCSCICLTFVFERMINLRRSRNIPKAFVTRFLSQIREGTLDRERALEICQENQSPIAAIFEAGSRKWGRPGFEVEQAIMDAGDRATNGLKRYLRVFSALTVLGPLIGLLGTAFGMIHAFNAVASSDPLARQELLAQGISQALLNTAFGLAVAIPAQSFYFFFVSRIDQLIVEMDALGQQLVRLISAEDLEVRGSAPRPKTRRHPRREAAAETEVEKSA
jgi:biopolymer transport protein ExbB